MQRLTTCASFGKCRFEKLGIRTNYGQAKIIGTLLGLSGAMVLTFYKGVDIKLWSSGINLLKATDNGHHGSIPSHPNDILGSFLAVSSCLCYALWLIIQVILTQRSPFTLGTIFFFFFWQFNPY